MIYLFKNSVSGLFTFVGVSDKGVSLASNDTGYVFILLKDFKKFLKPEPFKVVERMINKFDASKDLKQDVIDEMQLADNVFVKEVSIADYKKFFRIKKI